ncbi:MAG: 2-dehydro-3-deoxygluconokinase [Candidatus Sumerlaea sp.]|nr:PfkB family carbohydrate kinase [Candidatus Sumerlaea chitinivorans]GIX45486.1 MAG: 2-dehydro-3-deoxygluconokinase [Candidatus Sumerlaea sp.]
MSQELKVLGIGEVLWDVFGAEKRLGGAPFNFTYHCHALGAQAAIVSRVGDDADGAELIEAVAALGVNTHLIQKDPDHHTGRVEVTVGPDGIPSYRCIENVAWDYIEVTPEAEAAAAEADIVGFGTLAQRNEVSWRTIHTLLAKTKHGTLRVCDVNLRHQYYSPEFLTESLIQSEIVKVNEDEFARLQAIFELPCDEDAAAHKIVEEFDLTALVLTLGSKGARAWSETERAEVPGLLIRVRDTVGSGDAFIATFAMEVARGSSLATALYWANVAGAYVATQHGATPPMSWDILRNFVH